MSHSKKYLICYDIRDPRRLRRVHRMMRDVGEPVQFSVFEAELTSTELADFQQRLLALIDADVDSIGFYTMPPGYRKLFLGCKQALNDGLLI